LCSQDSFSGSDSSLEALEQRQKDILARLSALQKQVADLVVKHDSAGVVEKQPSTQVFVAIPVHLYFCLVSFYCILKIIQRISA